MAKPFELQAPCCDAVSMTVSQHGVRLAFGENTDDGEQYRVAIFMPHPVADQFQKLYNDTLAKHANSEGTAPPKPKRRK